MRFQSIQPQRRRLADEVYEQLIEAITAGEIGPEDNLVQEKLAADMQISRTPVREALMRLEQEGVLEVSKRGSFRLYQMDDQEVKELYQSRAAVEGQCARILAVRGDPADLDSLRDTVRREEDLREHTARAYFEAELYGPTVDALGHALSINPDHYPAIFGLGVMFMQFDEPARAEKAFNEVLRLNPHHEDAKQALERLKSEGVGRTL